MEEQTPLSAGTPAGLTEEEVQARRTAGQTNYIKKSTAKPTWKIFTDNICTYFNLIWAIIITVILCLGEYNQLFFVAVIFANTAIAIILELRAKHTLEKLTLLTAPRVDTIRGGAHRSVSADDLVLDDVIALKTGDQIPADSAVLSGVCEVNESLLTGESDAIKKTEGAELFAGSFLVSGGCLARVTHVGQDNYIQKIAARVKTFKAPQSYLFRDINRIIKYIGIGIVPFAIIMYFTNRYANDIHDALLKTAGSLEGMIPAGMFLLITVAFSMGVIKLSRRRTQVRDTYSIEMLSRTDTLCLDKTGTITDGTMRVVEEKMLSDMAPEEAGHLIAAIMAAQSTSNFTSDALTRRYTVSGAYDVLHNIPFSSKRKFTATVFRGKGTYAIGAPEFLSVGELPQPLRDTINAYAAAGKRVLMLAGSRTEVTEDVLPGDMRPLSLVVLEDHIREEAPDTIAWFVQNGVTVKIISGDNPVTVSAIARRVGVAGAEHYISLEGMDEEAVAEAAEKYTVFGRVTPDQKLILVRRLRADGHVVSMTGDGVNDAMALKEADCSIAMADGSEVARSLSNIVLLDNNFATLPQVVREGRQVVNNVQRSSTLFLMKTFFTIALSLVCAAVTGLHAGFGLFHGPFDYPFVANSLFMFETFVTGFPSVLLALQPNDSRIEGRFISSVLKQCVPSGVLLLINVLLAKWLSMLLLLNGGETTTLLTLVLTMSAFVNLVFLCLPINRLRLACILIALFGIVGTILIAGPVFDVTALTLPVVLLVLGFTAVSLPLHMGLSALYRTLFLRKKAA